MIPVPSRDAAGTTYEVTLELRRNGDEFGSVGERCGYSLASLANRLATARAWDAVWPDTADRFPDPPAAEAREPELFAFRYRDRDDVLSTGELRCSLRTSSVWLPAQDGRGGEWRSARRAVLEAWGSGGRGVRVMLDSDELARFLDRFVAEARRAGADYRDVVVGNVVSSPVSSAPLPIRAIIDC